MKKLVFLSGLGFIVWGFIKQQDTIEFLRIASSFDQADLSGLEKALAGARVESQRAYQKGWDDCIKSIEDMYEGGK